MSAATLREYREAYGYFSQKASDNARQLAFAGVAFVWVFKAQNSNIYGVPHDLYLPALLFAATLIFDFFHYVSASMAWGIFTWKKEKYDKAKPDDKFSAPRWLNWPGILFFLSKQIAICWGYFELACYLYAHLPWR